jgi:hypothetical protein
VNQKLKLGPLPSTEVIRLTIAVPVALRDDLERYAGLHAQQSEAPPDLARLIPHMLAAFLRSDRAFRRASRAR